MMRLASISAPLRREPVAQHLQPTWPDFSGWNCTPDTSPSSTAAVNSTP